MSESVNNSNVFDPDLEPLPDTLHIPDNDTYFLTNLAIMAASGNDPGLAKIKGKQFYINVDFVNGHIGPEQFINADNQLLEDMKAFNKHKALHNQK